MNIILTRPLLESEDLMAKFFSLGHRMIHVPTLKISPAKIEPVDLKNFEAIVFTSANAIKFLKVRNKNKNIICFCVGAITEKIARLNGFNKTVSAGGTANALLNLILNNEDLKKRKKIAYICGDNVSSELDKELTTKGYDVEKIINYYSAKITEINEQVVQLIENNLPHFIFVYSHRSAQSFIEIVKKYSLYPLMTASTVMCISKKVSNIFEKEGWKKTKVFHPGDELFSLKTN